MVLQLYNSLTRRKDVFTPMRTGVVQMFVCGPTVYDLSHVGHAKTYTNFDFVARYLRFCGYDVTYAQNITDVDDKVTGRARERGVAPTDIAEQFEAEYRRDMAALHNTGVDVYARATGYVDRVVRQIRRLIDRGHAYQLDDDWYFDLSTFPGYGKLSGRRDVLPEDSLNRIDENHAKRQRGDFVLWKARKADEPSWPSDLGPGRPGWHIEDTAITEALFGPQYDLHGGAVDLMFPHHEAEIAQMESASGLEPLARHWMHVGGALPQSAQQTLQDEQDAQCDQPRGERGHFQQRRPTHDRAQRDHTDDVRTRHRCEAPLAADPDENEESRNNADGGHCNVRCGRGVRAELVPPIITRCPDYYREAVITWQ